ncbi:MAG: hypothetical protein QOH25_2403 [Acidobacteriota bacterium]|jgi:hypothetical protein|nr:hypothetical protein [Acidobacteriota bacterium]
MYSPKEIERARKFSRRLRIGPFFKALLISIAIEFVVLVITAGAIGDSMMRHSAMAPRPAGEDLLAGIFIIFHFPSILIATPFELFIFAPLIQIVLMTCVIGFIIRSRQLRPKPRATF